MRGPVALVVVMTTLLVIGLGFLVYGLATKTGGIMPSGDQVVTLPKGSTVRDIAAGNETVALHVLSPSGEFVYLVNSGTGDVRNKIRIEKEK